MKILVINPGSTSTKIAVYHDRTPLFTQSIKHLPEQLSKFPNSLSQHQWRKQLIIDCLAEHEVSLDFDAVIGRGGLSRPVEGGVYLVNEQMIADTKKAKFQHACNLGCIIAYEIASMTPGTPAFIADPGSVDELNDYARISGSPLLPRGCIWHALNQRAIARRFAEKIGKKYEDLNLIICHLGGGISIAAHEKGRATDANNALDGEGPFSPERAGSLPVADLIKLCFSGKYTQDELLNRVRGKGGLTAHLATNDVPEILKRIGNGDEHARLILDSMIYHTAKGIASMSAVLCGKVDAILLTGGIAYEEYVTSRLIERIGFLAPVYCYPGENEMDALALNALYVLNGDITPKTYS